MMLRGGTASACSTAALQGYKESDGQQSQECRSEGEVDGQGDRRRMRRSCDLLSDVVADKDGTGGDSFLGRSRHIDGRGCQYKNVGCAEARQQVIPEQGNASLLPRGEPDDERADEDGDAGDRDEVGRDVLVLVREPREDVDADAGESSAGYEDDDCGEGGVACKKVGELGGKELEEW
jgi:hypothetical protein